MTLEHHRQNMAAVTLEPWKHYGTTVTLGNMAWATLGHVDITAVVTLVFSYGGGDIMSVVPLGFSFGRSDITVVVTLGSC